jgi:hypothetical protein
MRVRDESQVTYIEGPLLGRPVLCCGKTEKVCVLGHKMSWLIIVVCILLLLIWIDVKKPHGYPPG